MNTITYHYSIISKSYTITYHYSVISKSYTKIDESLRMVP